MTRQVWVMAALLLLCGATGCAKDDGEYATIDAVFDLELGTLEGTLHWAFVQGNPYQVDDPEGLCDIWETMDGFQIDLDTDLCPRCHAIYVVDVALDEVTCDTAPEQRQVILGIAPIESLEMDISDIEEAGYDLLVRADWNPHEGAIDHLAPLLAARSQSGLAGLPDGPYVAESIYVWSAE